jgi:amino acid transporter
MQGLVARLSLPEAIGLSLSIICPTLTAAFNITLVVQSTGQAAPLAYAVGTLAMVLIALSFMAFTRRVAHAGSAYAYISHTFGNRLGFIAGCALLLTYIGFATSTGALVGSFVCAALRGLGIDLGNAWIAIGAASIAAGWWLAYRDMRLAGRIMLGLESVVVIGVIAQTAASFRPSAHYNGWSGLGFGMVFCVLSFAGFEGAATLGEETRNPRRNIPIALLSTVLGSGVFFVFVAYCEVIGFGADGMKQLGGSAAPLNDLALRYASPQVAIALDLAAAASCFSGMLGPLAAAARMLFALGRGGLSGNLAGVHPVHGTPAAAVTLASVAVMLIFLAWAPFVGAGNFYSYASTIGVLALILVYIGVGGAEMVEAWREQRPLWSAVCVLGPMLLGWVLYCNLVPVPEYPNNLWPYVAAAWVMAAWAVTQWRPAVARAPLADIS